MPDEPTPRPWQPRFSVTAMLLLMLVVSVAAASGSYFIRYLIHADENSRGSQLSFILFTLAAPTLLVVIVSIVRAFARRL